MKKIIVTFYLLTLVCFTAQAQTTTTSNSGKTETGFISFKLKNNSLLPTKITIISYRPNETGNGTRGCMMGSYSTKSFRFPSGTRIYLANSNQVNTVMSGASITNQPPFLLVNPASEGKVFSIK